MAEIAADDQDADSLEEVAGALQSFDQKLEDLEFRRMLAGEMDGANAFLEVQAGSGWHWGSRLD